VSRQNIIFQLALVLLPHCIRFRPPHCTSHVPLCRLRQYYNESHIAHTVFRQRDPHPQPTFRHDESIERVRASEPNIRRFTARSPCLIVVTGTSNFTFGISHSRIASGRPDTAFHISGLIPAARSAHCTFHIPHSRFHILDLILESRISEFIFQI
jgi:hypothetical protein